MNQNLKRIGVKEHHQEEFFSPEENRQHFMVVSKDRFERTEQEIASTASMTAPKNVSVNLEAATALDAPITEREM